MGKRYLGKPGAGVRTIEGRVDPRNLMLIPETLNLGEKIHVDNPEAQPVTYSERAAHTLREKLWKMKHSKALAGLLDYLFEMPQKRTTHPITDLVLTEDKVILACTDGQPIVSCIFGTEWEILRCLTVMLIHVGATPEETDTMSYLLATKIRSNTSFTAPHNAIIPAAAVPRAPSITMVNGEPAQTPAPTYTLVDESGAPIPKVSNETMHAIPTVDSLRAMVLAGEPHEETTPDDLETE